MEMFIPSVLILLLAAAVVFFVLPRFGAPVLAIISVVLLVFGIYQHMNAFGTEYRLSTWQLSLTSYAPYIMVAGLLTVIAFYLLSISPLAKANGTTAVNLPEMPSLNEMPEAKTATNALTAGVNNALKGVANVAAAAGLANTANKPANNKGMAAPVAAVANTAAAVANTAKNAVANALKNVKETITGNASAANKPANNKGALANLGAALGIGNAAKPANNKGLKVPGLSTPLSQI